MLDPCGATVVGVEFRHDQVTAVVVDAAHEVLASATGPYPETTRWPERCAAGVRLVEQALHRAAAPGVLRGVGIGLPGGTPAAASTAASLRAAFADRFAVPVRADNNARLAGLAEWVWGAGQSAADLIYLRVATGVGGLVVLDGTPRRGPSDAGGELGHVSIEADGPRCRCSLRGCLETYVGVDRVLHHAGVASVPELSEALERGDAAALASVAETVALIAGVLAGLATVLDVPRVVVGGDLAALGEHLVVPLRQEVLRRTHPDRLDGAAVTAGVLGGLDGALGAVAMVLHDPSVDLLAPTACRTATAPTTAADGGHLVTARPPMTRRAAPALGRARRRCRAGGRGAGRLRLAHRLLGGARAGGLLRASLRGRPRAPGVLEPLHRGRRPDDGGSGRGVQRRPPVGPGADDLAAGPGPVRQGAARRWRRPGPARGDHAPGPAADLRAARDDPPAGRRGGLGRDERERLRHGCLAAGVLPRQALRRAAGRLLGRAVHAHRRAVEGRRRRAGHGADLRRHRRRAAGQRHGPPVLGRAEQLAAVVHPARPERRHAVRRGGREGHVRLRRRRRGPGVDARSGRLRRRCRRRPRRLGAVQGRRVGHHLDAARRRGGPARQQPRPGLRGRALPAGGGPAGAVRQLPTTWS